MIDALLFAVRDGIRAAGLNYDQATCDVMDDEKPMPRCGNFFLSIHDGLVSSDADNQLNEWYGFTVTLTIRLRTSLSGPTDRSSTVSNLARVPLGERYGFYAKADRIRNLLHMNWGFVVLTGQNPNSANDNISQWVDGIVYGFCEPMRYLGMEIPKVVGGEWFASEPDDPDMGIKASLNFGKARRMQPQYLPVGPFV